MCLQKVTAVAVGQRRAAREQLLPRGRGAQHKIFAFTALCYAVECMGTGPHLYKQRALLLLIGDDLRADRNGGSLLLPQLRRTSATSALAPSHV